MKFKTMKGFFYSTAILYLLLPISGAGEDDSLAGSFLSGLLDTITSTADAKDCPGMCVHTLATLICYEVLDDVPCPSGMKCCIESSNSKNNSSPHVITTLAVSSKVKPTKRLTTITTKKNTPKTTKSKSSSLDSTEEESCIGVCVADRIAEYCEAYLTTLNLCKFGTKCCVSLDEYSFGKYPKDLYVPANHMNNKTLTTTLKPYAKTTEITKFKHSNAKPTKNVQKKIITTTVESSLVDDDDDLPDEDDNMKTALKECEGECITGIFALFCDDIDSNAFCAGEGSCCITGNIEPTNNKVDEKIVTTLKPQAIKPQYPVAPPVAPVSNNGDNLITQILNLAEHTFSQTSPQTTPPPLPKCPGFCLLNIMSAFCERPSVLMPHTSSCKKGSVCCDNTRANLATKYRPAVPPTKSYVQPETIKTTTPVPDPREDCPGSCIVPLLSFTCFHNAEMTDLFKCKKSGQTCCAPKTKIQEKQGLLVRNDSFQYPMPPPYQAMSPPVRPSINTGQYLPTSQQYAPSNQQYTPNTMNYVTNAQQYVSSMQYAANPPQFVQNSIHIPPPMTMVHAQVTNLPTTTTQIPTTTTARPQVYSKYVCGVKGTSRTSRSLILNHNSTASEISKKLKQIYIKHAKSYPIYDTFNKSTERLILGTEIVPIQIDTDKLGDLVKGRFTRNIAFTGENDNPREVNLNKMLNHQRKSRVVGGEDGENGEWCWQVALINSLNQYLCGAALIGTQWVLTAAHCVTNIVRSGDAIYVRVGDYDLTRKYGSPAAQTLRVATTYIHHNHNSQTLDNDIALLKLHGQAELKDGVCLVCLPARGVSHAAGKRCTVTGYGYMGEAGPIPLRVREAELPIVSDAECIRKVNAVTEKIFILPASSFCAGGEEGNDACQGDGGGPLVCQDDGFYELVGLVSWGFGCGRMDVPGVYVKVSSFIGWINQIISVNNL
ncbi:protein masquerade [Condylostylus longicornis]|uniref:protein masquerade n=1 Tax=Condylostylus longicornis TaxID=2530218 RepID=UPI00244E3AF9|nr:protein masquerade [Condylostylus longicornis]XP_055373212.1 protein masquerade [Condylostylus longicornis]